MKGFASEKVNRRAFERRFPALRLAQSLHVLPDHNTIYVSNPKAAYSTIKLMLSKLHVGDHSLNPENVHEVRALPRLVDVGWRRLAEMLDGDAFRFTFVRHPVKRAISGYSDKLVRQRFNYSGPFQQALGRPVDPEDPVSFEDFLSVLERQDPAAMDPHWRPQCINVALDKIDYDYIGRVENFDADWARVRREAGLPHVPVAHRNRQPSFVDVSDRPDIRRRVEAIYACDFEAFGY